jgi:hypothetical protein
LQLDKTHIAIRERNWLDILDLSLQVLRTHIGPLLLAGAVGVVPMMLLNAWLLGDGFATDDPDQQFGSSVILLLWILIEVPLATAPMTLYLGRALFMDKPTPRQMAREFFGCLPQLILFQVIIRVPLIFMVVTWILPFAVWPFLNEVILLERNRLVARQPGELSTRRRSSALHGSSIGELMLQGLGTFLLALLLTLALWMTLWFLRGMLTGRWTFEAVMYTVYLQLAAWIVASYFTVARFLSYLDLRIRREGWEVELVMRAERARLARQLA